MITEVRIAKRAAKDLMKVPLHIRLKLMGWIDHVAHYGVGETRKIPGYHDEPLKGQRMGQRSIRLSRAYRAIYEIHQNGSLHFISIEEVSKHEY